MPFFTGYAQGQAARLRATRCPVARASSQNDSPVSELGLVQNPPGSPVVFYLPGTDGSGAALYRQLPALSAHGVSVRALYIPPRNRSNWDALLHATIPMLRKAVQDSGRPVVLLGESFGACLALRLALAVPELIGELAIINSATSFNRSLFGIPALISSTNLLSLFPEPLYNIAQAIVLPILLETQRTDKESADSLRAMMAMADSSKEQDIARTMVESRSQFAYGPAAAVNFRLGLMKSGNLRDEELASIQTPTLLICSAKDRLFASMQEGVRLQRLLPNSRRLILPDSGHTPMLESNCDITELFIRSGVLSSKPYHDASAIRQPSVSSVDDVLGLSTVEEEELSKVSATAAAVVATPDSAAVPAGVVPADGEHANESPTVAVINQSMKGAEREGKAREGQEPGPRIELHVAADGSRGDGAASNGGANGSGQPGSADAPNGSQLNIGMIDDGLEEGFNSFRWWRDAVSPVMRDFHKIPPLDSLDGRPLLFVGNHTLFGLYDLPLLVMEAYARGYKLTGLAHPQHWNTPIGPWFAKFGAVKASPVAAYKALADGKMVLLFPGGGREVVKRKGEEYQLMWDPDMDFVRLAAKANAIIVPFGAVGADDAFELFMDTDEILDNPVLGPVARNLIRTIIGPDADPKEALFPITKLPGTNIPSLIPATNFGRVYFQFGDPIYTDGIKASDKDACAAGFAQTKREVEALIEELLEFREQDADRDGWARLRGEALRTLGIAQASPSALGK